MESHEADGVTWTLYKIIRKDYDKLISRFVISNNSTQRRVRQEDTISCSEPDLEALIDLAAIRVKEITNLKTIPRAISVRQESSFGWHEKSVEEPVSEEVLLYVQKEHQKRRQKLIETLPTEAESKKLLGLKFRGFQYQTEDLDIERLVSENRVELKEKTLLHLVRRYKNGISLAPLAGLNLEEFWGYGKDFLGFLSADIGYNIDKDAWHLNGLSDGTSFSEDSEEKYTAINEEAMNKLIRYILSRKKYNYLDTKDGEFVYADWFDTVSKYMQGKYEGLDREVEIYYDPDTHFFLLGVLNGKEIEEVYHVTAHSTSCVVSFENHGGLFEPVFIGDDFYHGKFSQNVAYGPPDPKQITFGPPYASARVESLKRYLREKGHGNSNIGTKLRKENSEKAQAYLDKGRKYFPLSI